MESGWLGALLESPDLNHFHLLPQNHVNTSERTCPGRSDNAPLQESTSQSFLNRKQKGET